MDFFTIPVELFFIITNFLGVADLLALRFVSKEMKAWTDRGENWNQIESGDNKPWPLYKTNMLYIRLRERTSRLLDLPNFSVNASSKYRDPAYIRQCVKNGVIMVRMPAYCHTFTYKENSRYFTTLVISKEDIIRYKDGKYKVGKGEWTSEERIEVWLDEGYYYGRISRYLYWNEYKDEIGDDFKKLFKFGFFELMNGKTERRLRH